VLQEWTYFSLYTRGGFSEAAWFQMGISKCVDFIVRVCVCVLQLVYDADLIFVSTKHMWFSFGPIQCSICLGMQASKNAKSAQLHVEST